MKMSKFIMAVLAVFVLVGCAVGGPTVTNTPAHVAATATGTPLF